MILTFLIGGGSREDITSLVLLRPIAFMACVYGFLSLDSTSLKFRQLFALAAVIALVVALYLVPLPPAIWQMAAGREFIAQVDVAADIGSLWRPLSMDPLMTWNALFSLSVPLAVLLLGSHLPRARHLQIIGILVVLGLLSGVLGVLQALGPERSSLYFYRITNYGAAVGLFSNRNHHAIFLAMLLPMLAVFASAGVNTVEQRNRRLAFAFISGLAIICFILNTGSRNGLVVGALATLAAWRLFDPQDIQRAARRKARSLNTRSMVLAAGTAMFALLVFLVLRGQSFSRLIHGDDQPEFRLKVLDPVFDMIKTFFPLGSGPGAFVLPYQIVEPNWLLSTSYLNHAHNDWLEVLATMGVLGIAVLAFALFLIVPRVIGAFRGLGDTEDRRLAALGGVQCVLVSVASLVDYPLRTPSIMALFALSLIWLWLPRGTSAQDRPAARHRGSRLS